MTAKSGLLHQPRGRQAHHAGAEHRNRPAVALQAELGRELRRAPAQRDPAAAMAVIVDQPLFAELLRADHEPLAAIRPQARHRADDPARVDVHRHERRAARDVRGRAPTVAQPDSSAAEPAAKVRRSSSTRRT